TGRLLWERRHERRRLLPAALPARGLLTCLGYAPANGEGECRRQRYRDAAAPRPPGLRVCLHVPPSSDLRRVTCAIAFRSTGGSASQAALTTACVDRARHRGCTSRRAWTMAGSNGLFDLTGRTALVTGGGYGLGRGLVHGLASHGATVIGLARSEGALREAFSALGTPHRYIVGDLTSDALYEELDHITEHVDVVVNNAGGDPHSKPWGQQTTQEWRDTYEINVVAAERLCRLFIPKMAARGWGRVINISSIYGSIGQNPNNTGRN